MTTMWIRRLAVVSLSAMVLAIPALMGASCGSQPPPVDTGGDGNTLTGKYVGAERCVLCHSNTHRNWAGTLHAQALETLEAIGQGSNPVCLECHTVGFNKEGGFVDRATTEALAGVQCESCHDAARDHVENVSDESLRPKISIAADICGKCHTDSHHPTMEEWSESGHATVTASIADRMTNGTSGAANCATCHSGDARLLTLIQGGTITDTTFKGMAKEQFNAVTCVICHTPHSRTGNAAAPDTDRDYQLRYPEAVAAEPTNDIPTITTDLTRYNLCGQCHHDRGADWTGNSRPSHHSIQNTVYIGEMPIKTGGPLVPNTRSVHRFVQGQCATCHIHRTPASAEAPAVMGHTFEVNTQGCSAAGCHPNEEDAVAVNDALHNEVQSRLEAIKARLGDPATWQYPGSEFGGPASDKQSLIPEPIRKVRYMHLFVEYDGSRGTHNPAYIRSILTECERLLTVAGK